VNPSLAYSRYVKFSRFYKERNKSVKLYGLIMSVRCFSFVVFDVLLAQRYVFSVKTTISDEKMVGEIFFTRE